MKKLLILILLVFSPSSVMALTPIARTNVVPYQRIQYGTTFNFGVVAFSKAGIDRVDFVISGCGYASGTKSASSMSLNTQVSSIATTGHAGVWEYWVAIPSSEFSSNGAITVTPTVYGNDYVAGVTGYRVLDAVPLIVEATAAYSHTEAWVDSVSGNNSTGTVGNPTLPYLTIAAAVTAAQTANGGTSNGNIIYLQNGSYALSGMSASTTTEYLTIARASGASKASTIITSGRPDSANSLIKFSGVTLQRTIAGTAGLILHSSDILYVWVDDCDLAGGGRWGTLHDNPIMFHGATKYSTNNYFTEMSTVHSSAGLVRGAKMQTIGNDAFINTDFVINCIVDDQTNGTTGWHADAFQLHSTGVPASENRIVYGYKVTNSHYQGIFMRNSTAGAVASNNAFVNVLLEMREPYDLNEYGEPVQSAMSLYGTWDHFLMWHCTIPYGAADRTTDVSGQALTNASFIGNQFYEFSNNNASIPQDYLWPGNTQENVFAYNAYQHVYGVTPACTPTSVRSYYGQSCPHVYSLAPDTIGGTAIIGNPLLDTDFKLTALSPLIGVVPKIVPTDIDGNLRGALSDVGAYEYTASSAECSPSRLDLCDISDCESVGGGYWYNSTCNASPEAVCGISNLNLCLTSGACTGAGGYWCSGVCQATPCLVAPTLHPVLRGGRIKTKP
jgi:hypothetical protein